jgi:myo-inositol-1-phosphate synthase
MVNGERVGVWFLARAHAAGRAGPVPELAFFFKDPVGNPPQGLAAQYAALHDWAASW